MMLIEESKDILNLEESFEKILVWKKVQKVAIIKQMCFMEG